MGLALEQRRIPDVLVGGRDVPVADQRDLRVRIPVQPSDRIRVQLRQPLQLVRVVRIGELTAVGDVQAPDADAVAGGADGAGFLRGRDLRVLVEPGLILEADLHVSRPTRDAIATPFHWLRPTCATSYPSSRNRSYGNCSSLHLVSCIASTSTSDRWSQSRIRSVRARTEFTFQVAMRTAATLAALSDRFSAAGFGGVAVPVVRHEADVAVHRLRARVLDGDLQARVVAPCSRPQLIMSPQIRLPIPRRR